MNTKKPPKCPFSLCWGPLCLQGPGKEHQVSTSKLPRLWAVVETEKLHPDQLDFGYCIS